MTRICSAVGPMNVMFDAVTVSVLAGHKEASGVGQIYWMQIDKVRAENGREKRFHIRSRLFTEAENKALEGACRL